MDPRPTPRIPTDAIGKMFAYASGVPTAWQTRKRANLLPQDGKERAFLLLTVQSPGPVGTDEKRTQLDGTTNDLDTIIVSHRTVTIAVRAHSWDPCLEAYDLCERIRLGLNRDEIRALMVPTIALISCDSTHALTDEEVAGRIILAASMDVRLRVVLTTDPQNANEGDWIATVDEGGVIPFTLEP